VVTTFNTTNSQTSGPLAAVRTFISRDEFFAGLYILGCANGLVGRAIYTFHLEGLRGAVTGFESNAIVLFALYAGIAAILSESRDELRPTDLAVAVIFLVLVSVPIFPLSWVAVAGLSLYILLFANGGRSLFASGDESSDRQRGALILLALTFPMVWSRLLFQFFANTVLDIDAAMVASLLGTDRVGNLVGFRDGSGYMMVTAACTSFTNLSFVFLCWVSVTQWAKHRWSTIDLLWLFLACASVVAVNVTRIALTGLSHRSYELIHNEWGEMIIGTIILAMTIGFSVFGARRELLSSA